MTQRNWDRDIRATHTESWMLRRLRESFERQTPEQRQATVERVRQLLDLERGRKGMHSYLWRHRRTIYGIDE